jgi:hypothetical protein
MWIFRRGTCATGEKRLMKTKFTKNDIRELMATWGRKGGSRATDKQRSAALENLKRTPNHQKHNAGIRAENTAQRTE